MYGGALLILGGSAQTRVDQGATTQIWVQNAGFIWVPLIVLATVAAWFGMDNIATVRAGFTEQVAIIQHKQQWRMSWLYTGTFGSFIGLAAGFPMLVNTQFPAADAFKFAFIGPVLAALVRPLGGWLADRMGGATITVLDLRGDGGGAARSRCCSCRRLAAAAACSASCWRSWCCSSRRASATARRSA